MDGTVRTLGPSYQLLVVFRLYLCCRWAANIYNQTVPVAPILVTSPDKGGVPADGGFAGEGV